MEKKQITAGFFRTEKKGLILNEKRIISNTKKKKVSEFL